MIPEQAIVEWRREAPWQASSLIEQDLIIISRALVEMYSHSEIAHRLAFVAVLLTIISGTANVADWSC